MWRKIKQLTNDHYLTITWVLMPLIIFTGLIVGTKLYKLSTLDISEVDHRHGTIQSIEKDFNGYRERLRYKIKLKESDQEFYIKNVMIDKVQIPLTIFLLRYFTLTQLLTMLSLEKMGQKSVLTGIRWLMKLDS